MEHSEASERVEEFVRRYERVLVVAVAVLLVLLLASRGLRGLRVAPLAGPVLIVALLVVGWLLH